MLGFFLETQRCPDGVELFDYGEPPPGKTILSATGARSGLWFRYRTDRREPLRLEFTSLENPLAIRLINARDNEARAEFLSRFGVDTEAGQERGGEMDESLSILQGGIKEVLKVAASGDRVATLNILNGRDDGLGPLLSLDLAFDLGGPGGALRTMFKALSLSQFIQYI